MHYIALINQVNIRSGGNCRVSMGELKFELEKYKYKNVMTYLHNGNIIFELGNAKREDVIAHIKKVIQRKFNLDVPVYVLTVEELEDILNHCPPKWGEESSEMYDSLIFITPPSQYEEMRDLIITPEEGVDFIHEYNQCFFWTYDLENYKNSQIRKNTLNPNLKPYIVSKSADVLKSLLKKAQRFDAEL